jgi:uncharacterized protein YjiS (DUF1127 family)
MAAPDCNRNRFSQGGDDAVTAGLQVSPANILWENLMLARHSSQSLNWIIRSRSARIGGATNVVLSDDRGVAHADQTPAASSDFLELRLSRPTAAPAGAQTDYLSALCWSMFTMIMEGFAAYGTSQCQTEASVESTLTAAKAAEPRSPAREPAATEHGHHVDPRFANSNVLEFGRVEALDAGRRSRRNWPKSLLQASVTLWTHWRREREIRKAVMALGELDDRTLRDIGIPHRSQIDEVVRYCRDC